MKKAIKDELDEKASQMMDQLVTAERKTLDALFAIQSDIEKLKLARNYYKDTSDSTQLEKLLKEGLKNG